MSERDRARIEERVRRFAPEGLEPWERGYFDLHWRRFADTVALLPPAPRPGARLLDVGVFPGHIAALAQERGYAVAGLSDATMTEAFRRRAGAAGFEIATIDVEAERFPHPDDAFDAVLCCEIVEHLNRSPFAVLAEIFRVLRPGGVLVLTTPNLAALGKVWELARGRSFLPPLSGPIDELFPLNPNLKHEREYAAAELVYLLRGQERECYRFLPAPVRFSSCWDEPLRQVLRRDALRHPALAVRRLTFWALTRLVPRLRSCLMVAARKPQAAAWVPPAAWRDVGGLHPLERDEAPASRERRALPAPFAWSGAAAALTVANPLPGSIREIVLRCGYLAPDAAPGSDLVFTVNGAAALAAHLAPGKELRALRIPVPAAERGAAALRIALAATTWQPSALGIPDDRHLGAILSWEPLLALGEA